MRKLLLFLSLVLAPGATLAQEATTRFPSRSIAEQEAVITQLALGPKARVFYTANVTGEVRAYDLKKGELLWKNPPGPVAELALGTSLLAYTSGLTAFQALDPKTGEKSAGGIGAPNLLSKSTCLVVGKKDRWVWIGTEEGVMTRLSPGNVNGWSTRAMKNGGVECAALNPAAKVLAVGGRDGSVRFVGHKSANVDDKKFFESRGGALSTLAFGPKGKLLVTGGQDGALRVWKMASGKVQLELETDSAPIESLAVDPKAKWFAAAQGGQVTIRDLAKGETLATLTRASEEEIVGLAILGKGKMLLAAGGTNVTLWDISEL